MIVKGNLKFGDSNYQFEADEKDEMESLHRVITLSNPPKRCQCGDYGYDNKSLVSNKDKEGNTYVNIVCGKCGARAKLGQYKAGGYFWHKFELYKAQTKNLKNDKEGKIDEKDIPF